MLNLALAIALLASPIWTYNLDTDDPIVFSGPPGSEFGHSLSFHRSKDANVLLVGAPADSYSDPTWTASDRSGLNKTGVLYRCPWPTSLSSPTVCRQLRVDTTPPFDRGNVTEVKTNMRLGQSVISTGPDGIVVVCASRWGKTVECNYVKTGFHYGSCYGNPRGTHLFNNIGKCIILPADLNLNGTSNDFAPLDVTYPPTEAMYKYYENLGIGRGYVELGWAGWMASSLGFSMSATPEARNTRFPLTQFQFNGPGFLYMTGVYVYANLSSGTPMNARQQAIQTGPNADSASSYNNVLGYFDATGVQKRALARPLQHYRTPINCTENINACTGPSKRGQVWIMTSDSGRPLPFDNNYPNSVYVILQSSELTDGFGLSLLALDTDNDNIDELYIGAPYYMDFTRDNEVYNFEFGAVYTYSKNLTKVLAGRQPQRTNLYQYPGESPPSFFAGPDYTHYGQPGSRFGFAMAAVGDINNDGFQDMAIGAPGEFINDQQVGAVYIYTGSATGIGAMAAQRIVPQDLATRGFGYSLAYGWDIDSNGYSDIAVGAIFSSTAFIFRSRPIISVKVWLKPVFMVDATQRPCPVRGGTRACFKAEVCAEYTGTSQKSRAVIGHTLRVNQDALEMMPDSGNSIVEATAQITLREPNTTVCHDHTVYVRTDVPNLCLPSNISVTEWSLVKQSSTPSEVYPVLVHNHPPVSQSTVQVNLVPVQCSTCRADLTTTITAMGNVTSGRVSSGPVRLDIRNRGNLPACTIATQIQSESNKEVISSVVDPQGLWECSDLGRTSISCNPTANNRHYGALASGATASLTVKFRTDRTRYPFNINTFPVSARTSSSNSKSDSMSRGGMPIHRSTNLSVGIGAQLDEFVTLKSELLSRDPVTSNDDLPFALTSTFQVLSSGPSLSTPTNIVIKYPISTTDKETLYYLTSIQASTTGVSCNSSALVNAKSYSVSETTTSSSNVTYHPVTALSNTPPSRSPSAVYKECSSVYCRAGIMCQVPQLTPNTLAQVRIQWRVNTSNIDHVMRVNLTSATLKLPVSVKVESTVNATRYTATITTSTASRSTEYILPEAVTKPHRNLAVVVGGAGGAVAFIIILFAILHSLGFFKPNRDLERRKSTVIQGTMDWPEEVAEADRILCRKPVTALVAATLDMN